MDISFMGSDVLFIHGRHEELRVLEWNSGKIVGVDVLVRLVELVEALGFSRGHFGHGGPVHKLSHGTLSGQVHFAIIPAE